MNYITIEQSEELLELGMNPDTADMAIVKDNTYRNALSAFNGVTLCQNYNEIKDKANYIPCWSLGALLEVMPKVISVPVDERSAYFYRLEWQFANDNSLRYIATDRGKCLIDIYSDHDIRNKSFIETAFEMVVWLLENGYIKKGE